MEERRFCCSWASFPSSCCGNRPLTLLWVCPFSRSLKQKPGLESGLQPPGAGRAEASEPALRSSTHEVAGIGVRRWRGHRGSQPRPTLAGLSGERRAERAGASCRAPALGAGWGHPAPRPFQVSPSPSSVLPASRNLAGKREPGHLAARVSFTVLRSNWLSGGGTAASGAVRQHATRAGPHLGVLFAGVPVGLWWGGTLTQDRSGVQPPPPRVPEPECSRPRAPGRRPRPRGDSGSLRPASGLGRPRGCWAGCGGRAPRDSPWPSSGAGRPPPAAESLESFRETLCSVRVGPEFRAELSRTHLHKLAFQMGRLLTQALGAPGAQRQGPGQRPARLPPAPTQPLPSEPLGGRSGPQRPLVTASRRLEAGQGGARHACLTPLSPAGVGERGQSCAPRGEGRPALHPPTALGPLGRLGPIEPPGPGPGQPAMAGEGGGWRGGFLPGRCSRQVSPVPGGGSPSGLVAVTPHRGGRPRLVRRQRHRLCSAVAPSLPGARHTLAACGRFHGGRARGRARGCSEARFSRLWNDRKQH